jgi:hypothetical protein
MPSPRCQQEKPVRGAPLPSIRSGTLEPISDRRDTVLRKETPMARTGAILVVVAVLLLGSTIPAPAQTLVVGGVGEPVSLDTAIIQDGNTVEIQ